jgi:hypothetical protein
MRWRRTRWRGIRMFSGRVVLARMDLSTGAVTEEEVSTEDLWEIRLYRDESTKNYTTLIASDGGFITAKAYQPSRRLAVYPESRVSVALRNE